MPLHELPRTGDSPVLIDGEVVARAQTGPLAQGERRFELAAYLRHAEGPPKYAVAVGYLPPAVRKRERETHWVLLCDETRDIGPALAAWREANPVADLLLNFPPAEQFASKKAHLAKLLDARLREAIGKLLSAIPGTEVRL